MSTSSPWSFEQVWQTPGAFRPPWCKIAYVTCQAIAKDGWAGIFQIKLHPCSYYQENALYVQEISAQEQVLPLQFSYQPFFLMRELPFPSQRLCSLNRFPRPQLCLTWGWKFASRLLLQVTAAHPENTRSTSNNLQSSRALVAANTPLQSPNYQRSYTVTVLSLQNLATRSIIRSTHFCSSLSIIFSLKLSLDALDTRFSGETRDVFFIALVYQG